MQVPVLDTVRPNKKVFFVVVVGPRKETGDLCHPNTHGTPGSFSKALFKKKKLYMLVLFFGCGWSSFLQAGFLYLQ